MIRCVGCGHLHREENVCPIIRYVDGLIGCVCRGCFTDWAKRSLIDSHRFPFWARQEGRDVHA